MGALTIHSLAPKKGLDNYMRAVKSLLPETMDKGRFITMMHQVVKAQANSKYVTKKESILPCVFNAAKLGLEPDPVLGQIYFIPYRGVLTYQVGYKGMLKLSQNSGKVADIRAGLVYENDSWDYYEDEKGQHYKFKPNYTEDRGKELFGYSIMQDKDGKCFVHIMESARIDSIKKIVLARTPNSPWANTLYEEEMRKKTVIRRHWKTLPMSVEIARAVDHEERSEIGEEPEKKLPVELEEFDYEIADFEVEEKGSPEDENDESQMKKLFGEA